MTTQGLTTSLCQIHMPAGATAANTCTTPASAHSCTRSSTTLLKSAACLACKQRCRLAMTCTRVQQLCPSGTILMSHPLPLPYFTSPPPHTHTHLHPPPPHQVLWCDDSLAIMTGINPDAPVGTKLAFVSGGSGCVAGGGGAAAAAAGGQLMDGAAAQRRQQQQQPQSGSSRAQTAAWQQGFAPPSHPTPTKLANAVMCQPGRQVFVGVSGGPCTHICQAAAAAAAAAAVRQAGLQAGCSLQAVGADAAASTAAHTGPAQHMQQQQAELQ